MSHGYKATEIAWSLPVESATERLILLAIAKHANDDCVAYPSVDAICQATGLNRKTVFSTLKKLIGKHLDVSKRTEKANANTYRFICLGSTEIGSTEIGT